MGFGDLYVADSQPQLTAFALPFSPSNYNTQPTPGVSGSGTVDIGGNTYIVTQGNYGELASEYIDYRRSQGDTQYNPNTYQGQQSIIAVSNAFRTLVGLPRTYENQDGVNTTIETSNIVLDNPVIQTVDSIKNAGTKVFGGINSALQGALGTAGQLGDFTSVVGKIFGSVGGLIVVAGIGYLIWRKFK